MNARFHRLAAAALLALAFACAAPPVARAATVGGQFRYWAFEDGNDLRDPLVYVTTRHFDGQLEYWDSERGLDQTRVELGVRAKDSRRSAYFARWRHERFQERAWLGTEQVAGERLVLRATAGPILPHEGGATLFVWEGGADVYWGSYSFAGATLVRDPREGGLWSVPLRSRFASERNDWLQFTVAPASKRTFGWAVDGKWRVLRAGVERNSRFDFTTRDNVIFTLGFEREFGGHGRH